MITKEITLSGHTVTLAYSFGAAFDYKQRAGEDMADYANHVIETYNAKKDPDPFRTIKAILSCQEAFYAGKDQKGPLTEKILFDDLDPFEMLAAAYAIVTMRQEFYHIPPGAPKENPAKGTRKRKNA